MFLTTKKIRYEQSSVDFINPKLPDYSAQCQKEIDQIQHLYRLNNELSEVQKQHNQTITTFNRLKINCRGCLKM